METWISFWLMASSKYHVTLRHLLLYATYLGVVSLGGATPSGDDGSYLPFILSNATCDIPQHFTPMCRCTNTLHIASFADVCRSYEELANCLEVENSLDSGSFIGKVYNQTLALGKLQHLCGLYKDIRPALATCSYQTMVQPCDDRFSFLARFNQTFNHYMACSFAHDISECYWQNIKCPARVKHFLSGMVEFYTSFTCAKHAMPISEKCNRLGKALYPENDKVHRQCIKLVHTMTKCFRREGVLRSNHPKDVWHNIELSLENFEKFRLFRCDIERERDDECNWKKYKHQTECFHSFGAEMKGQLARIQNGTIVTPETACRIYHNLTACVTHLFTQCPVESVYLNSITCASMPASCSCPVDLAQETRCSAPDSGKNFTSWQGIIRSPGYDGGGGNSHYPVGENCNWNIVIPDVILAKTYFKLNLTFTDFNLGHDVTANNDIACPESGDYLQILGLRPGKSQPICRQDGFPSVASEFTRKLQIKFISDDTPDSGNRGFSFRYFFPDHPCAKCKKEDQCDESLPEDQMQCINPCDTYQCGHGECHINGTNGQPYCKCQMCFHGKQCFTFHECRNGECLDTSQGLNKGMCNCTEGIKDGPCDEDPCKSKPCLNQGTCKPDLLSLYKCTCSDKFMGDNCERRNYCFQNPCKNGTCESMADKHKCNCAQGFHGENCDLPNDGTYCEEGVDSYNGSHIFWNGVRMGEKDEQPCPYANGVAVRHCSAQDDVNGTTYAYWEVPDLSQCVSSEFRQILEDAKSLTTLDTVPAVTLLNLTDVISAAISNGSSGADARIYAGDLTAAADVVHTVGNLVEKTESSDGDLHNIAKGYGTAVDHIINPKASSVWRFSRVGYLENRITSLLDSMETFSSNVAKRTSYLMTHSAKRSANDGDQPSRELNVTLEHLDFSVRVLDRTYNFSRVSTTGEDSNSSISLPQEVFVKAVQGTSDPYIHMYSAKFPSVSTLLEETNSKITAPSPTHNVTAFLNSDIVSTSILNVPAEAFTDLQEPVILTFSLQDSTLPRILKRSCVFMNMSATSRHDQWKTDGCTLDIAASNLTYTVCSCRHLTNFAVLMDVYGVEDNIDDLSSELLTYISYVGGGLSILGCTISIVIFEFFRIKNERIRVHEQLAATIILVQLFFLVGIDRTENRAVCKAVAICLHYFLLAMFSWMLVEGTHLYLALVKVFKSHSHMKKYVLIGWGAPLVIVGISAGIFRDYYGSGSVCWLPRKVLLVAFIPPVSLVVVINTVVLLVVMRIMLRSMSRGSKMAVEDRSSLRIGLKAAAVLLPLLGLTWTFGFLSITSKETLIFTYLFTFFNSTQGVFFFVFHCLLSVDVQNAYERRSRRRSQMRLTESSSSSRGPRRESEYDSSIYNYSKTSVKTAYTDAGGSLDRRHMVQGGSYSSSHRPQSVTFDEDVFLPSPTHGSLTSRNSNAHRSNVLQSSRHSRGSNYNDVINAGEYDVTGSPVLNNVQRSSLRGTHRSTDGYVLYYGKDGNSPVEPAEISTILDKNQLYATVQKGL